MVVTNHDASCMPNFLVTHPKTGEKSNMKFDRILCDVPCTGDGTLRKNADIWPVSLAFVSGGGKVSEFFFFFGRPWEG
jgi:16S rRNA C967 or C1407 C5-methylase (RsmB/RsmF family)